MNNFKKLLAVVIVVTMLVTAMIPVMAADSFSYEDEAQVLSDLGLMVGDGTDLDLGGKLTREMGAVLLVRLLGAEEDALALTDAEITAALKDYTDNDDISFWAEAYVAYATDAGFLAGRDDGSLDPKANLLGKDYATMILRAMGYEVDAEGWAIATTLLAEVDGLSVAQAIKFNDKALIRDDAAGITYAALLGETADEETLIAALIALGAVDADDAVAAGLYTKPVAADVKAVTMTELREVVVTFTAPVNVTEAKKVANYSIATKAPTAAVVAADGKSVTLTVDPTYATTNYASYVVVVKAAVGIPADVTKTVVATDVTIPTLVSATPVGPRSIKLTFSENLDLATAFNVMSSLKLDNGTIAVSADAITAFTKTITVNTYIDLAETAHTIAVSGNLLKDVAGYAVQASTLTFNYVKDSSALSYTVGATTETTVKITFNKAIAVGTFAGNGNVYVGHSYNNSTYPATITTSDNLTFTLTWATTTPLTPGNTTVYVGYTSSTGAKIKDQYGIVMEAFSFPVTTNPDFVKPTVSSVVFTDATHVAVTFSEAVEATSALTTTNYVLKDSAGAVVGTTYAAYALDSSNAIITSTINLTTGTMNGGSYTLEVKGIKDRALAGNVIDTVIVPFVGTDKVAPAYAAAPNGLQRLADKIVKINFTEAMDATTTTNKNFYRLNGAALLSTDTVVASADGKSVIVTFTNTPAGNLVVTSAALKDVAGNWMNDLDYTETFAIAPLTNINGTAAMTSTSTIKVTFVDIISGMTVNDFLYSVDGVTYATPNSISVEQDATKTYVTLYIADQGTATSVVPYNTIGTGITVKSNGVLSNVKNAYGNVVELLAQGVADKTAPKMISAVATHNTTTITSIAVTFSENLYQYSVSPDDFTVAGLTVSGISVSGNVVTLNITALTGSQAATPVVTLAGTVEDNYATGRNALTGVSVTATNP